ncbi:MAG TPA: hypothetical protein VHV47_14450 [Opitutaceae bacterium]|jgi:hypothetical protein|nr:hypothetical protein [Opitutaceae bacterium]
MSRALPLALLAGTALLCRAQAPAAPAVPAAKPPPPVGDVLMAPAPAALPASRARPLPPTALDLSASAGPAIAPTARAPLTGQVEDNIYTSPTGAFSIPSPVLREFGGSIADTGNVVTFQDEVSTLVSIATFPMNASERWKLQLDGPKDYLAKFFNQYVLADFQRAFPGTTEGQEALFMPHRLEGAMLIDMELPGGSMFANKVVIFDPSYKPRAAKRGNLIFLHNGYVFVISIELAERVLEGTAYTLTPEEEDLELRERLEDTLNRMKFLRKAPSD